jgi:hypothetical protein
MKELIKPNLAEEENPELDYYCETRNKCSCSWGSNNDSNTSVDSEDEIVF